MLALTKKINLEMVLNKFLTYFLSFAFLTLCANTKLYLPLSPVPITMHTFAVATLGMLLPLRVSLPCFIVYLVEGLIGSPIFGVSLLFGGPSFGYLIGMIVSLVFLNRVRKTSCPTLLAVLSSSLIIWFFGVLHLQFFTGIKTALLVGVVPFIIGDLLKVGLSSSLIRLARKKKNSMFINF